MTVWQNRIVGQGVKPADQPRKATQACGPIEVIIPDDELGNQKGKRGGES